MAKWVCYAPNGNYATVNHGGYRDLQIKHGQIIEDETLAKAFPSMFVLIKSDPIPEKAPAPKVQMLTEVPAPIVVEPEVKDPEMLVEDVIVKAEEVKEDTPSRPTRRKR